jgi:hypothetical protein
MPVRQASGDLAWERRRSAPHHSALVAAARAVARIDPRRAGLDTGSAKVHSTTVLLEKYVAGCTFAAAGLRASFVLHGRYVADKGGDLIDRAARIGVDVEGELERVHRLVPHLNPHRHIVSAQTLRQGKGVIE